VKPDGFGYLFEATLNLFGVRQDVQEEYFTSDLNQRYFSEDIQMANGCGGIFRLLYNYSFLFLMKKQG